MATSYTQAQIDKLKEAIALGALRVRYADRDVTYRSLAEMRETLGIMESEVSGAAGRTRTRKIIFQTAKGV